MTEISKEYAEALFELARESSSEQEIYTALTELKSIMNEYPEYTALLSAPSISARKRELLAERAFNGKVPDCVVSFLKLLCKNGRFGILEYCITEYELLYNEMNLIATARIVSAIPLSDSEKTEIIKRLEQATGKTIKAEYESDEKILGGVVIYIDDKIIDGSIRHSLNEIKDVIGK